MRSVVAKGEGVTSLPTPTPTPTPKAKRQTLRAPAVWRHARGELDERQAAGRVQRVGRVADARGLVQAVVGLPVGVHVHVLLAEGGHVLEELAQQRGDAVRGERHVAARGGWVGVV